MLPLLSSTSFPVRGQSQRVSNFGLDNIGFSLTIFVFHPGSLSGSLKGVMGFPNDLVHTIDFGGMVNMISMRMCPVSMDSGVNISLSLMISFP